MLTGILAARNIAGGSYDVWSVNVEQTYHEEERGAAASERLSPRRVSDARSPSAPAACSGPTASSSPPVDC